MHGLMREGRRKPVLYSTLSYICRLVRLRKRTFQSLRGRVQSLVTRPNCCPIHRSRRQQVHIDISNSLAIKFVAFNMAENFVGLCNRRRRQLTEEFQNQRAIAQATAGNFTQNKRMHHHFIALQEGYKSSIASAKVIHPYRCIN